jgi:hypothetical protein
VFPGTRVERRALAWRQVPGVLQQQEACLFERGLLLAAQATHFAAPHFIHGAVQMLRQMKPIEADLRRAGVFPHRLQIRFPPIRQTTWLVAARRRPKGVKNRTRVSCVLSSPPEQDPALQVVDHPQVVMAFAATHLVDPQEVQRPTPTAFQPVGHYALHDGDHAFPVQPEGPRRFLPTQMPGQFGHQASQRLSDPRPGASPYPTAEAVNPARAIAENQRQPVQQQITPAPGLLHLADSRTGLSAYPATQAALPQTVNLHHDSLALVFHGGHSLSFQFHQFPDKGFQQHLLSTTSASFVAEQRKVPNPKCSFPRTDRNLLHFHTLPSQFWERSQKAEGAAMIATTLSRLKQQVHWPYLHLCASLELSYASFRRWRHRFQQGQPALFKPGPQKVAPLKLEELRVALSYLKHGRQRSRGGGRLCRQYQGQISRRDLQALTKAVRRELAQQL